mgnify:CR=1 FL=1
MIAHEARMLTDKAPIAEYMKDSWDLIERAAKAGARMVTAKFDDREIARLTIDGYSIAPAEKEGEYEVSW